MESRTPLFRSSRFKDGSELADMPWVEYFKILGTTRRSHLLVTELVRGYGTMPQGRWMTRAMHDDPFALGTVGFMAVFFPIVIGSRAGLSGMILALAVASPLVGFWLFWALFDLRGEKVLSALFLPSSWTPERAAPLMRAAAARAGMTIAFLASDGAGVNLVMAPKARLEFKGGPGAGGAVVELTSAGQRNAQKHCELKACLLQEFGIVLPPGNAPGSRVIPRVVLDP